MLTPADVKRWLTQARGLDLTDATVQRGISVLEQLLSALTPKETALLPNYPNPFNPRDVDTILPRTRCRCNAHDLQHQRRGGTAVRARASTCGVLHRSGKGGVLERPQRKR